LIPPLSVFLHPLTEFAPGNGTVIEPEYMKRIINTSKRVSAAGTKYFIFLIVTHIFIQHKYHPG
jgi:hypothetical protein